MSFSCPGCGAPIDGRPDRFVLRCGSCDALLRSHSVDTSGPHPVFDVQVAGRPDTRRRVEVPWGEAERRRLSGWLLVASVVTVTLVLVLFVLARAL